MQKSIEKMMHLGIDFLEEKWRHVGTKIGAKVDVAAKAEKSTKR